MRSFPLGALLIAGLLVGCASTEYRPAGAAGAVIQVPYRLVTNVVSDVPDPYYVVSGPLETYKRYRVNETFRAQLTSYAQQKSGGRSAPRADLLVHLKDLTTDYDEIGAAPLPLTPRGRLPTLAASMGHLDTTFPGPTRLAANVRFVSTEEGGDNDLAIPLEIHKSVRLTYAVEIRVGEEKLEASSFVAEAATIVTWYDYDSWAYDYGGVIEQVIEVALRDIDQFVNETLRE